jgi:excisionase family DNA binding protein
LLGAAREAREPADKPPFGFSDRRRVIVESEPEGLTVGRHAFRAGEGPDVLTLAQAASLLQIDEATVAELATAGDLPGRRIGDGWRFARKAVLDWLGNGEAA